MFRCIQHIPVSIFPFYIFSYTDFNVPMLRDQPKDILQIVYIIELKFILEFSDRVDVLTCLICIFVLFKHDDQYGAFTL